MSSTHTPPKPLYAASSAPTASMLDIVSVNGNRFAVARHLVTTGAFTAKDEFEFNFGGSSVTVKGKRLLPVYRALVEQRLLEIRVGDPLVDDEDRHDSWIDSIELRRPDETGRREWV